MSETGEHPDATNILKTLARYTAQLLLVYPLTLIAGIPLFLLTAKLGIDGNLGHGVSFAGFAALICIYMGFLVGWLSGMRIPSLIRTGAWIWLLPTAFVLYDIVCALRSGAATRLSEYFYATGDNAGLGVFLLTLPVSSTVGYSIGMVVAKAQRAHPTAHAKGPGMRIAFVWAATFAIACTLMIGTERRMVERDRKIRVAVSVTGTPLASEVNALCEPVETGAARTSVVL
jgi:hypothetical protein